MRRVIGLSVACIPSVVVLTLTVLALQAFGVTDTQVVFRLLLTSDTVLRPRNLVMSFSILCGRVMSCLNVINAV